MPTGVMALLRLINASLFCLVWKEKVTQKAVGLPHDFDHICQLSLHVCRSESRSRSPLRIVIIFTAPFWPLSTADLCFIPLLTSVNHCCSLLKDLLPVLQCLLPYHSTGCLMKKKRESEKKRVEFLIHSFSTKKICRWPRNLHPRLKKQLSHFKMLAAVETSGQVYKMCTPPEQRSLDYGNNFSRAKQ